MDGVRVIVVLGNGDDEIYTARITHAIALLKEASLRGPCFLCAKSYQRNSWSREKLLAAVGPELQPYVLGRPAWEHYLLSKYSYDTIEEAVMFARCLDVNGDQLFSLAAALTSQAKKTNFIITVVTTESHARRSDALFNYVFAGIPTCSGEGAQGCQYVNAAPATACEVAQNRVAVEAYLSDALRKAIERYGSFVEMYVRRPTQNEIGGELSRRWAGTH